MVVFRELKDAGTADLRVVLEQSLAEAKADCPDLIVRPIQEGRINNYRGAFLLVGCPGESDRPGEVNLVKVVGGNDNLYMIQRTWRMPALDPNNPPLDGHTLDLWTRYLSMQKPCDVDNQRHPCGDASRPPPPFMLFPSQHPAWPG